MSEKSRITRRRGLAALATIGLGGAAAGAGTYAAFFDEENETGSKQAGTLVLDTGTSQSLTFTTSDIKPTDTGTAYADLAPSGSLTGDLTVDFGYTLMIGRADNGTTNLDGQLEYKLWLHDGSTDDRSYDGADIALLSDGTADSNSTPAFDTVSNYSGTTWTDAITGMSGDWTLHVEWRFPDASSNNDAQGDQVDSTFTFTLNQQ